MAREIDFTSSLYLGFDHPSCLLPSFDQLTTGAPAAVRSPKTASTLARRLAELIGCEDGLLVPSTLHLFWDLFGILSGPQTGILLASNAYPILRWGVERAAANGTPVQLFSQQNVSKLWTEANKLSRRGLRPVIASDGMLTREGRAAPLSDFLAIARAFGGYLVVDDTQALGLLGHSPSSSKPYGLGGGGSLQWHGISGPDVIVGDSLAKGFGVPLAVLAGSRAFVRRFESKSQTRSHCSPPNFVEIGAGMRAVAVNRFHGERLRCRLLRRVLYFRRRLSDIGLSAAGGLFPIQVLNKRREFAGSRLAAGLLRRGIHVLLLHDDMSSEPLVAFAITAKHSAAEIDAALLALQDVLGDRHMVTNGKTRVRRVQRTSDGLPDIGIHSLISGP